MASLVRPTVAVVAVEEPTLPALREALNHDEVCTPEIQRVAIHMDDPPSGRWLHDKASDGRVSFAGEVRVDVEVPLAIGVDVAALKKVLADEGFRVGKVHEGNLPVIQANVKYRLALLIGSDVVVPRLVAQQALTARLSIGGRGAAGHLSLVEVTGRAGWLACSIAEWGREATDWRSKLAACVANRCKVQWTAPATCQPKQRRSGQRSATSDRTVAAFGIAGGRCRVEVALQVIEGARCAIWRTVAPRYAAYFAGVVGGEPAPKDEMLWGNPSPSTVQSQRRQNGVALSVCRQVQSTTPASGLHAQTDLRLPDIQAVAPGTWAPDERCAETGNLQRAYKVNRRFRTP